MRPRYTFGSPKNVAPDLRACAHTDLYQRAALPVTRPNHEIGPPRLLAASAES